MSEEDQDKAKIVNLRVEGGGLFRAEQARSRLSRKVKATEVEVLKPETTIEKKSWQSGMGMKGGIGPNTGKTAVKFLCRNPDADNSKLAEKRVFTPGAADWKKPVSLWYKHDGEWHLVTVIDGLDAAAVKRFDHYTQGTAGRVDRPSAPVSKFPTETSDAEK